MKLKLAEPQDAAGVLALYDSLRHTDGCTWGETGGACEAIYSASKAGIIGLTRAVAKEVGSAGVRVNCVSPGVIDTRMNGDLSAEDLRALAEETPLERIGAPDEVAEAIYFLAGERAAFITGQVLSVNGGMVIG